MIDKAGREYDAAIARFLHPGPGTEQTIAAGLHPAYTSDMNAAWKLLDHARERWRDEIRVEVHITPGGSTQVRIIAYTGHGVVGSGADRNPALAVCQAWQKAVGVSW